MTAFQRMSCLSRTSCSPSPKWRIAMLEVSNLTKSYDGAGEELTLYKNDNTMFIYISGRDYAYN